MSYKRIPLFPPACASGGNVRMPVFGGCEPICPREECQTVRIYNPACPAEFADVDLCVDGDGNLSICVRKPPRPYAPPRRARCDCRPCMYR